ncbi:MAG TPA: AAA family ATPase [Nitrososphaeraceae archaeon]|nr:AAA family ATPase [Nitrososphaeraceae archaeon]
MSSKHIEEIVHRSYNLKPKYTEILPGVPEDYKEIKTLGDLLQINYKHISVEEQIRGNLIAKMKNGEHPYAGIIGYDDDVIPAINRAILSGHDILFVGQIGQAKTKVAESIAKNLLSLIPVVRGTMTNDIPSSIPEEQLVDLLNGSEVFHTYPEFAVSKECEDIISNNKLETKIDWKSGIQRYRYLLATPDISVKDLVGQIDAIKIAKKGVELYSIESYSPGQLLQARHGILCIDELPVLDPRKQVALLSVLQEGKFTTGSYPVVFKPDVKIIATSNPIDYTHSGKIIEPLFDRLRSHINTHYPKNTFDEMLIIVQEARIADTKNVFVPVFILKSIAKITHLARNHQDINQDKGVSVRMAVHSLELLIGEAERTRSILHYVNAVPRFCDIHSIHQSSKFELSELEDNRQNRINILDSIISRAIKEVSLEYVERLSSEQIAKLKSEFAKNKTFLVSQMMLGGKKCDSGDYESQLIKFPSLKQVLDETIEYIKEEQNNLVNKANQLGIKTENICVTQDLNGEFFASVAEVVLEGLRWIQPPLLDKKDNNRYELV